VPTKMPLLPTVGEGCSLFGKSEVASVLGKEG